MPGIEYDLIEGLDPTVLAEIGASELLQMVRQSAPRSNRGLVIASDDTPDVANNPRLARFLWIKPSENNAIIRRYNIATATWEVVTLAAGAVGTAQLADGAVTLAKLEVPGLGNALKLIRVNVAGTGWEYWTLAWANNSQSPSILTRGGNGFILRTKLDGSDNEWFELNGAEIISRLSDYSIPLDKLQAAVSAGQIMVSSTSGTDIAWSLSTILASIVDGTFPIIKLETGGVGNALKVLQVNASGSAFQLAPLSNTYAQCIMRDEKAANTPGGTFASGAWQARALTIKPTDTTNFVTLDAGTGQFTLPAGTYRIKAIAPAYRVNNHVAKLVNITVPADIIIGTAGRSDSTPSSDSRSFVEGRFTLAAPAALAIQHRCTSTQVSNGFGDPCNVGVVEVYTTVELLKEP